jgi:ankyrin repeat protein
MIDAGADPNSVDANGAGTLLNFHPDVIRYLMSKGADPDIQRNENILPVLVGVAGINTDCVEAMLSGGADPNIASQHNGETALHHAVCGDRFDEVKVLLEAGADPNQKTIAGEVTYMLWRDARVRGETALHRAAAYGTIEVIQLLLEHSADPNIRDANGDSPLSWASWHMREKAIIDLLGNAMSKVK